VQVYGPHMALLYGRPSAVARLASINHFFLHTDHPERHPYKLQPGNVNFELFHSLPAIVQYLGTLGAAPSHHHHHQPPQYAGLIVCVPCRW
jgi:hypothetical protein